MTIVERALELVEDGTTIGLGSGRAAQAFVWALGERVRGGDLRVRGVTTSEETAALARQVGILLGTLQEAGELAVTIDGADEVDPHLDLTTSDTPSGSLANRTARPPAKGST